MTEYAKVAKFWNRRPCNISHSDWPYHTLQYSREVTARKYTAEPHIRGFAEHDRWRGMNVLDMGCGIGTDTLEFALYGARVDAVDISARSLLIAQARAKAEGLSGRIRFFYGNVEDLTSLNLKTQYDLAYSFGVIHHTPTPLNAFREAYRFTRPGGEFRCMVYNRWSWRALQIVAKEGKLKFWQWSKLISLQSEAQAKCPYTYTYTKKGIAKILKRVGFDPVSVKVDHIFVWNIPAYIQKKWVKEWYWRLCPNRVFEWLKHHFGWHMLIRARRPISHA